MSNDEKNSMSDVNNHQDNSGSFWSSLPAVIRAFAVLLPAIGGLLVLLCQTNIIECQPNGETEVPPTLVDTPTTAPAPPIYYDIRFCDKPCSEAGAQLVNSYPEKTKEIFMEYSFRGMIPNISYSRIWAMNTDEWVHYDCVWKGLEQGTYAVTLKEPMGLKSGSWIVTFLVDQKQVAQETILVLGNYDYWDPAGTLDCPDY